MILYRTPQKDIKKAIIIEKAVILNLNPFRQKKIIIVKNPAIALNFKPATGEVPSHIWYFFENANSNARSTVAIITNI